MRTDTQRDYLQVLIHDSYSPLLLQSECTQAEHSPSPSLRICLGFSAIGVLTSHLQPRAPEGLSSWILKRKDKVGELSMRCSIQVTTNKDQNMDKVSLKLKNVSQTPLTWKRGNKTY